MGLPSDEDIRAFLTRAVHDAEDLALLSRTKLKDQLQAHFAFSGEDRLTLDVQDKYKTLLRTWIKEAIESRTQKSPEDNDGIDAVDKADSPAVEDDAESSFSSLEDEEPQTKRKAQKEQGGGAAKKSRTSSARGTDPVEATLKRLKAYVLLSGTRKPWKKIFAEKGCGKDEVEFGSDEAAKQRQYKKQINVVKDVLTEIGMTTPYSKVKAQKIKEDKEFKQELEAIQQAGTTERSATRSVRARRGAANPKEERNGGESSAEDQPKSRPKAFANSLATFAAELNDSD